MSRAADCCIDPVLVIWNDSCGTLLYGCNMSNPKMQNISPLCFSLVVFTPRPPGRLLLRPHSLLILYCRRPAAAALLILPRILKSFLNGQK